MLKLRDYQNEVYDHINDAWRRGADNVLAVLPTGAGKTILFTKLLAEQTGYCVAIAHRHQLVEQISLAFCAHGIPHRIVGQPAAIQLIIRAQREAFNDVYYDPYAPVVVASVDTLIRRQYPWFEDVNLWVQDEAHHILRANKWGRAVDLFPHAKGLGVTATPLRADGRGLSRLTDGVMDTMIVGRSMRDIIESGHLTDYRIFAPTTKSLDLAGLPVSATTGDYSRAALVKRIRKSKIVGDVVEHYKKIADGKLGITFVTDVETGEGLREAYRAQGVPAECISYKTPDADRARLLRKFRRREVLQLVNVDLFGEGFDLPAVEVCSFARPTESYGLYVQQFGRALRPMQGKGAAIIIDHVGNVVRHGLPDAPQQWTLERREKKSNKKPSTLRTCIKCLGVFERFRTQCPYCDEPVSFRAALRNGPEQVDGDLTELSPGTLAALRGAVATKNKPPEEYYTFLMSQRHAKPAHAAIHMRRRAREIAAREKLTAAIAQWAGIQRQKGLNDREKMKMFYLEFGVDAWTIKALPEKETRQFTETISASNIKALGDTC